MAEAKQIEKLNVAFDKIKQRKFVVTIKTIEDVRANPQNYEFVCDDAHADGDFSYLCTGRYCRCSC